MRPCGSIRGKRDRKRAWSWRRGGVGMGGDLREETTRCGAVEGKVTATAPCGGCEKRADGLRSAQTSQLIAVSGSGRGWYSGLQELTGPFPYADVKTHGN
jgi:hypothetical protein